MTDCDILSQKLELKHSNCKQKPKYQPFQDHNGPIFGQTCSTQHLICTQNPEYQLSKDHKDHNERIFGQKLEFSSQHSKSKQKPKCRPFQDHNDHKGRIFAVDEGSDINEELDSDQTKIIETRVDEGSSIKEELDNEKTKIMETGAVPVSCSTIRELDSRKKVETGGPDSSEKEDIPDVRASLKRKKRRRRSDSDVDTSKHDISDTVGEDLTERTEPIAFKELKELFNSFEIKIPDESFASVIVQKDVHYLVTTVNSLSNGVVLSTKKSSNTALIFEMEVVDDGDQFCVVKKDNSSSAFHHFLDEDNPTKVILIKSKSLPIVKAKLMVYKKYKHIINERKIFLQHEYEEFDDVAKMVAYQKLMTFCTSVESVINAFSVDLYKIITDYVGNPLTANKIKELCFKAFNESLYHRSLISEKMQRSGKTDGDWIELEPTEEFRKKRKRLETFERTERDWRDLVATHISEKREIKCTDPWSEIWNACRKTVDDLGIILSGLEEFRTRVLPVDQNKQIDELLKMEVIVDIASLHEYPSIIRWIAGQRDDKNVVKVYLSGDNAEKAKEAFKKECKLKNTEFEFVNIAEKNEMPKEIEKTKALEREAPDIDKSTIKELKRIIQEHTDKLYARYSNIIGIQIGRSVRGDTLEHPCIIFYCLDKTLIPFGEKKIPKTLAGWPCDVREDFIRLGTCTPNCRRMKADRPELGCSIGKASKSGSGSVGFMYESMKSDKDKFGFLTASHVAIEECHRLHVRNTFLSDHPLGQNQHTIVHPSWDENAGVDNPVGEVVESFFGNYGSSDSSEGLDFAEVKTKKKREGEKETVGVYNEDDGISKIMVMKTGRTTGLTFGQLDGEMESIRMQLAAGSNRYYIFRNLYVVYDISGQGGPFFKPGDSGSGVFVAEGKKPGKALGIGFATSNFYPKTFVCKIAKILNFLGLTIVRQNY